MWARRSTPARRLSSHSWSSIRSSSSSLSSCGAPRNSGCGNGTAVHSLKGRPGTGEAASQLIGWRDSAATDIGLERSSARIDISGAVPESKPILAVVMKRCGGVSSVIANARRAPTMSANWARRNVAAVTKSGASEITESSWERRSPLSCGRVATAELSRFESLKSPLQICIFCPHPVELVRSTCDQFARTRSGRRQAYCFGVLEVGVDRCHDDSRFDRHQIDADEGDAHPRVDDDTLVENAVENID